MRKRLKRNPPVLVILEDMTKTTSTRYFLFPIIPVCQEGGNHDK
jgi:hypothetical protein